MFLWRNIIIKEKSCCQWSHGLQPKKLEDSVACNQLLFGFLAKGHLFRVLDQSCLSAVNGAVHRSPGIYHMAEENPRGRPSDEGCVTSQGLKWVSLIPNDVAGIAQHVRKGEEMGRKEKNLYFQL